MPNIDTEKIEAYAQQIFERENQFNSFTLKNIARRIKTTGQLSAHDQQALKNIADVSGDMDKITKELARITEMNVADLEKIYAQTVNDGLNSYKPLYDLKNIPFKPITENKHAMQLVHHWTTITAEKMINLSKTKAIGFVDKNGNFTDIRGAYQQTIDDAVVAVSTGTTDFNSAMKGTIESLGGSGVVANYGSGITRSLEAMVRQNLLWGAKSAAQSVDDYVSDELGLDGFEVDAHAGCRPTHEFMQGQMYSYDGDKIIDGILYKDGKKALDALNDYNCLHFKTGVLLGVSEPRYSKQELARIHEETTKKIEYNGRSKTLYEWKQTQRRLEREYRKTKTQSDMFKESGNNIAAKDYKRKADIIKATYDDLTDKIPGLYDHSERMRTYFNNTKKLTSGNSEGIINTGGKINEKNFLNASRYEEQANRFYAKMLENDTDIIDIEKNVNMTIEDLKKVKYHMMANEIKFKNGEIKKFDADIDQALAWQRLKNGKNIKPTDELLLQHELLEFKIMEEKNLPYEDAHELANKTYNWEKEIINIIDDDELLI